MYTKNYLKSILPWKEMTSRKRAAEKGPAKKCLSEERHFQFMIIFSSNLHQ